MPRLSKRNKLNQEGLTAGKVYALSEAVKVLRSKAKAKFDETVDVALAVELDSKKPDQAALRGMVSLPHSIAKACRVAVFAKGAKAEEAKKAGADVVGGDDLADIMNGGDLNFDRVIATPDMMAVVGKLGKVLGPKGLMPNPKLGTVTMDVTAAVSAAKAGQLEFRADKTGIIHAGVAKASMKDEQIIDNVKYFVDTIKKAKPASVKGNYMVKLHLSTTMGPGLKVSLESAGA